MKPHRKNTLLLLSSVILCFLSSCVDDSISNDYNQSGTKSTGVTINLSLEKVAETMLKSYTTGTNSPRLDFNAINDINIIIYTTESLTPYVYYYSASTPNPTGLTFPITSGTTSFSIYTTTAYTGIYVVGNYGSAITPSSIQTVNDLKSLTTTLPLVNVPDKCVMFAQAIDQGTLNANGCKNMNAALQRGLAMVTVSLNGKGLFNGVNIRPTRISIKNVPASMPLGLNNTIINSSGLRSGYSLIDSNWPILNNVDSLIGYNTHGTTGSLAFFTYENMQGTNSSIGDQIYKKSDPNLMPFATYITVEAQYNYGTYSGDIIYKFCLGTNVTDNYDVIRNTHYIVTLNLSGWGGAQEGGRVTNNALVVGTGSGVNWRVTMNLYDFGFGNTNFNFDSHVNTGVLPVRGSCKFATYQYDPPINTANASEHWILTTKANNTWIPMETGSADAIKNNQFTYFIKPWRYTDPGFPKTSTDRPYRECTITIVNSNGTNSQTVVFRQWAPIKITNTLYLERFDEGKTSGASNLRWGYNETNSLPTGFVYWTLAGADNNKGFENTKFLGTASPAGLYTLQKGGYNTTNVVPSILASQFKPAAYYLPTSSELDTISRFVVDLFNPSFTGIDPINKTVDYWSSSANNSGGTYYWNKTSMTNTLTTGRTALKKVRSVYRPSKDTP